MRTFHVVVKEIIELRMIRENCQRHGHKTGNKF